MPSVFSTFSCVAVSLVAIGAWGCSSEESKAQTPAVAPCPEGSGMPDELRCTGLYADWTKKTLAENVVAYKPGVELWSDGADKHRYFSMPKGTKIDTSNPDEWVFPVGTKAWKEFRVNGKKVETRVYAKQPDGQWLFTTYRWLPDESRADRLESGRANAEGTYSIPDTQTCEQCHRGRKDKLLGIEAIAASLPGAEGLTLAKMKQDGMLTADVTVPAIPDDAAGKAKPALAYLHMNCGASCHDAAAHSPALQTGLVFKLHLADLAKNAVDQLPSYTTSVGKPIAGNAYFEYTNKGYQRITPGAADKSLVPELARLRDVTIQMPPIGSHQKDAAGIALIESWINAMPTPQ